MCFVNNTQSLVWMEGLKHRNVSVFKRERINVDGTYGCYQMHVFSGCVGWTRN